MADKRKHRGPHPQDAELFAPGAWPRLREAVADCSWLLSRGYASVSSLKLVGDRYQLEERQRMALMRCSCSDSALEHRRRHEVSQDGAAGEPLLLDGYNILTTVEAALSGAVILVGRDGCCRDLASMHGTFRRVEETLPAIGLVGAALTALKVRECVWYLDSPVSNSGRLREMLLRVGAAGGYQWQVELVNDPDPILRKSEGIVVSADSVILDSAGQWFNLTQEVISTAIPQAVVIHLGSLDRNSPAAGGIERPGVE